MPSVNESRSTRLVLVLAILGGALLTLIGIRYFLVPQSAARTFGVPGRPAGYELHYIIGLRNVWLGLLAVALALLREWRALALWFAAAVVVCFADGVIAAVSTGGVPQVAFHFACGIASVALAILCARRVRDTPRTRDGRAVRDG
jgi:hypothetical protein